MDSKDKLFLPSLALFIWALASIATSAAVWNARPGVFFSIVAAVNVICSGWGIYKAARGLEKED